MTTNNEAAAARGRAMMKAVYGWDIGEVSGAFTELTLEHLFGEIWSRPSTFSIRERRLILIGLAMGSGMLDVTELQLECALRLEEMSVDELREIVVFLAHYAGWPRAAQLNTVVEKLIARRSASSQ